MYLTIKDLAARFNISASTVASDISRNPKKLPPFIRIGRAIRFSLDDIIEWEQQHRENLLKGN
ncbi:DNA-binding protein [Salmonella enterica subsp. enterica]|uniref:helix-turn-helix transcriptional regulator n=1 Tax=Salmonella enterica TaxID=28901 RepID=UPI001285B6F6|nr:DNA-binding protein [Salmonella enterica subsp. enterica]EGG4117534.1 helix-turn-helix domain-containing protein [Salmonella enterica]EGG4133878.1 helix-turn-helix domain-containing protein [Salmonella enterica]